MKSWALKYHYYTLILGLRISSRAPCVLQLKLMCWSVEFGRCGREGMHDHMAHYATIQVLL